MNPKFPKLLFLACLIILSHPRNVRAEGEPQTITAPSGASLFTINGTGSTLEIISKLDGTEMQLKAKGNAADKRIYSVYGKEYKVKSSTSGFKLELPDGTLLWKAKLTEEKIKVSNNEENKNPFEIKKKSNEKLSVETENDTLGIVRWDNDTKEAVVKNQDGVEIFKGKYLRLSGLFGLLIIKDIPADQKAIMVTEFALRGL